MGIVFGMCPKEPTEGYSEETVLVIVACEAGPEAGSLMSVPPSGSPMPCSAEEYGDICKAVEPLASFRSMSFRCFNAKNRALLIRNDLQAEYPHLTITCTPKWTQRGGPYGHEKHTCWEYVFEVRRSDGAQLHGICETKPTSYGVKTDSEGHVSEMAQDDVNANATGVLPSASPVRKPKSQEVSSLFDGGDKQKNIVPSEHRTVKPETQDNADRSSALPIQVFPGGQIASEQRGCSCFTPCMKLLERTSDEPLPRVLVERLVLRAMSKIAQPEQTK